MESHLRIKIAIPAIKRKANKTLRDFLSKRIRLSKFSIKIVKGEYTSKRILKIANIEEDKLRMIRELVKLR